MTTRKLCCRKYDRAMRPIYTPLNSSLLKHGRRMAKRDTVNKNK